MTVQDLQQLVDLLAAQLQRSVTVTDPEIRILAASAHFGDEDEARVRAVLARVALPEVYRHIHSSGVRAWTRAGIVPAAPALGFKARFVIPVRRGSTLLALLMVIVDDEQELRGEELRWADQAAQAMVRLLDDEYSDTQQRRMRRSALFADLLSDRTSTRHAEAVVDAAQVMGGPVSQMLVMTMLLQAHDVPQDHVELIVSAGIENAAFRDGARLAHTVNGRVVTVGSAYDDVAQSHDSRAHGARLLQSVSSLLGPDAVCVMGMHSAPVELRSLAIAMRQSRVAAEAAAILPRFGPVAVYSELGAFITLLSLTNDELSDVIGPGLRRLFDADSHGVLRLTLQTYLATGGAMPQTAKLLALHRTSLYYRLNQIAQTTGLDVHDGETRLMLHLGLKAAELLEARASAV